MTEYIANQFTSIFPFGIIARGEFLRQEHIDALGEAQLADMVKRGVLSRSDADHGQDVPETVTQADTEDAKDTADTEDTEDTEDTADDEEPEDIEDTADDEEPEDIEDEEPVDLGIDPTDDLVNDEGPASPDAEKKKSRGGKKK